MNPKDNVFMALCLALCAMGFLIANLMKGLWFDATFAAVVMIGAAVYVVRFIARAQLPQAFRRNRLGG